MFAIKAVIIFVGVTTVSTQEIIFKLHTFEGQTAEIQIGNNNADVQFATDRQYKVLCHGWIANDTVSWYQKTRTEYERWPNTNVITTSYHEAMASKLYIGPVNNVKPVGKKIGDFVLDLSTRKGIDLKQFHLIGHSLGAHIAGFAGKQVTEKSGKKIGRITGLDPAAIGFNIATSRRISKQDADFVDIIHTSTMGLQDSLGTADFYPNGGKSQPGCNSSSCSHNVSPILFYQSINSYTYASRQCADYKQYQALNCENNMSASMGALVKSDAFGDYFVTTDDSAAKEFSAA